METYDVYFERVTDYDSRDDHGMPYSYDNDELYEDKRDAQAVVTRRNEDDEHYWRTVKLPQLERQVRAANAEYEALVAAGLREPGHGRQMPSTQFQPRSSLESRPVIRKLT